MSGGGGMRVFCGEDAGAGESNLKSLEFSTNSLEKCFRLVCIACSHRMRRISFCRETYTQQIVWPQHADDLQIAMRDRVTIVSPSANDCLRAVGFSPQVFFVLFAYSQLGISGRQEFQFPWVCSAEGKEIGNHQSVEAAPTFCKAHTAPDCGVVGDVISGGRVEHDEIHNGSLARMPSAPVTSQNVSVVIHFLVLVISDPPVELCVNA
jgi:hypothetical protein